MISNEQFPWSGKLGKIPFSIPLLELPNMHMKDSQKFCRKQTCLT